MSKVFLLYKCNCCDNVFRGAESDLGIEEVIHGMAESWYEVSKLHTCVPGHKKFGISKLVGCEEEMA